MPAQPFIKSSSHFGVSLAHERLFIESKANEKVKFDIFSKSHRNSELEGDEKKINSKESKLFH